MIKLIIVALLAIGLQASSDFKLKYFIEVNNTFKGVLVLDNKDKKSKVIYYNITSRDKIPFYAPSKDFSLTTLNSFGTLATLKVDKYKKRMLYDVSNISPDEADDAGIAPSDVPKTAIIYDKDDLPTDVTEKRLIHTIESLMLSMFNKKDVPKEAFYLFEPHKKMLLKVRFTKEANKSIELDGKMCKTSTWVLNLEGRNKRLIRVYLNPYPIRVEAFSKKWSFSLVGVGQDEEITLMKKDIALRAFKRDVLDTYSRYSVKILSQKVKKDKANFTRNYETRFSVSTALKNKKIQELIPKYLQKSGSVKVNKSEKDSFVYKVSAKDVNSALEDRYNLEDENHYWLVKSKHTSYINILKMVAKKKKCKTNIKEKGILCKDDDGKYTDEESIDMDDYLEEYLAGKLPGKYKIEDIDEDDDRRQVRYKVLTLTKITKSMRASAVKKAFRNEYEDLNLNRATSVYNKSEEEYKIYISKKSVAQFACITAIKGLKSKYKAGMCQATATNVNNEKEANAIVSGFLNQMYPDLEIMNVDVKNEKDKYRFVYLENLKKVKNACK